MESLLKLQNGSDIRGVALDGVEGEKVNLTQDSCYKIGAAFVRWLSGKTGIAPEKLRIGIGMDSRLSGPDLEKAVEDMLIEEQGHFTTPIFLAMNGHDISVGFPRESEVIKDAKELFDGEIEIEHTNLEKFWEDAKAYLDPDKMTVLEGERRAYLKEGKWTFLFPGTISARTYLKQADFNAYTNLAYYAEPLNAMAGNDSTNYLNRGWKYLISNHTHDANGGCAPDCVCKDMEYRFRKASDIGELITDDAMVEIAKNLSPEGQKQDVLQLVVYNTLPFERDVIVPLDMEIPKEFGNGITIDGAVLQSITSQKSSIFMDNIWDVPTILESVNHRVYAKFEKIPAFGYKTFEIKGNPHKLLKTPGIAKGNHWHHTKNEKFLVVKGEGKYQVAYIPWARAIEKLKMYIIFVK